MKRAIFVKRITAGRLSCKREQRFGNRRNFYNASRRVAPDRLENMPYNGIGFTGDISGTMSTPKEYKTKTESRPARGRDRNVERARGALWA